MKGILHEEEGFEPRSHALPHYGVFVPRITDNQELNEHHTWRVRHAALLQDRQEAG